MSISDEFREQIEATPDRMRSWVEQVIKGYRGATHGINRCLAEYADQHEVVVDLVATSAGAELDRRSLESRIDELERTVSEQQERLERMAEYLNEMKKNGK